MRYLVIFLLLIAWCWADSPQQEFISLRDAYLEKFRPLEKEANLAWWEASTTGSKRAYARRSKANKELARLHSDGDTFAKLKALKEGGEIGDPVLSRQLKVMYLNFLAKQADPELNARIIELETEVDQIFNTHRSQVQGQRMTENDVRKILKETQDNELAREAWSGYMAVGRKVNQKLPELVRLRNQVARKLGFENYFKMMLELQELKEDELFAIFDELDQLTREPFMKMKSQLDQKMMKRFGLAAEQLRPWHTDDLFFQEAPRLGQVSLDGIYTDRDPVKMSIKHYDSLGLETSAIVERSSLYEKEGKSPHAFCINIDRYDDVRVLCNVKPNVNWMDTMHHELGHGVYDQYIAEEVPYLLRAPAHIMTTEGMAMLFGALTKRREFLDRVVALDQAGLERYAEELERSLKIEKLVFSRWTQVMLRFEQGMYSNPDQDLNQLWWNLKKEYQGLNPPDDMGGADYAAKMHIVGAPVYYHNYMLGDLFASQVQDYAAREILGAERPAALAFTGEKEVGSYFRLAIFGPGNLYNWRELVQRATGEPLSARAYAELYVR